MEAAPLKNVFWLSSGRNFFHSCACSSCNFCLSVFLFSLEVSLSCELKNRDCCSRDDCTSGKVLRGDYYLFREPLEEAAPPAPSLFGLFFALLRTLPLLRLFGERSFFNCFNWLRDWDTVWLNFFSFLMLDRSIAVMSLVVFGSWYIL